MGTVIDRDGWAEEADERFAELAAWRSAYPRATLREIEDAVEVQLARLRDRLVADTIRTSALATGGDPDERSACPGCGGPLRAKGVQRRRITTHRGGSVEIARPYGYCPRCGAGLFPPGSGA
jgi:YgiT-type zinc finger domain-containing protein